MNNDNKTIKTNAFTEKANNIHNGKYSYNKVDYINTATKVTITCPIHGDFKQKPTKHIKGQGCPKCAYITTIDKILVKANKFIEKANKIHGTKYTYIPKSYSVKDGTIKIICPVHGEFTQTRYAHLKHSGCKKCAIDKRSKKDTLTTEEFIKRSKAKHGDTYDYSKTEYINSNTKVTIICKIHGEFEQYPRNHYNGAKCTKCTMNHKYSTSEWIENAKNKHGDRYDYSRVNYTNKKTKVILVCKKHGEFKVTPDDHIHKQAGCPLCSESKGEQKIRMFLDLNSIKYNKNYRLANSRFMYDFYLPEMNILIEYDGLQHFKPVEFFGGEKAFKIQKKSDKEKDHLAKINNIPLIRIPFTKLRIVEEYLAYMLCSKRMYVVNNKYYRNILDLCKGEKLPMDTSPKDVVKFKLKNKLILHAEKHVE